MRILIVEDDFTTRRILQRILSSYGTCDIAVNGREALEAFSSARDQNEPYHLICLDIMMPELDGHHVLQQIRAVEEGNAPAQRRTCVVMTTGLEDAANFMQAVRGGCAAYLPKPIDPSRLIATLRSLQLVS